MSNNQSWVDNLLYRFQPLYNQLIRPYLPKTTRKYNGIKVKDKALLDRTSSYPNFEGDSIRHLTNVIESGDRVVIVGGGRGVTAVYAAQNDAFHVRVYEAASESVDLCRDTAERNGVSSRVSVEHALVGDKIDVWGQVGDAIHLTPEELPPCDVLELDCEGAEIEILEHLGPRPHSIVVECHPMKGAPESEVRNALPEEYRITSETEGKYDNLPLVVAELDTR